jgi:hypothetical protein
MRIKYNGTIRIAPLKDVFESIFSIHYFDNDVTPKAASIILFNREWYWEIGEWPEEE